MNFLLRCCLCGARAWCPGSAYEDTGVELDDERMGEWDTDFADLICEHDGEFDVIDEEETVKTIRERFPIGSRVKLSNEGKRRQISRILTGVVTGYGYKHPETIRVKRDGCKGMESYHSIFWLPEGEEEKLDELMALAERIACDLFTDGAGKETTETYRSRPRKDDSPPKKKGGPPE